MRRAGSLIVALMGACLLVLLGFHVPLAPSTHASVAPLHDVQKAAAQIQALRQHPIHSHPAAPTTLGRIQQMARQMTHAQQINAQSDSCSAVTVQIATWGGYWEILSETCFDSVCYVSFTAYFPAFGEWWYGSCYEYY